MSSNLTRQIMTLLWICPKCQKAFHNPILIAAHEKEHGESEQLSFDLGLDPHIVRL